MDGGTAEPSPDSATHSSTPTKHTPQANDGGARRDKSENTMIGVMSDVMSC